MCLHNFSMWLHASYIQSNGKIKQFTVHPHMPSNPIFPMNMQELQEHCDYNSDVYYGCSFTITFLITFVCTVFLLPLDNWSNDITSSYTVMINSWTCFIQNIMVHGCWKSTLWKTSWDLWARLSEGGDNNYPTSSQSNSGNRNSVRNSWKIFLLVIWRKV